MLVVIDQFTRRRVGIGVHRGAVTGAATSDACSAPPFTGRATATSQDHHDPLFEAHRWTANLRILEIDEIKTVPNVPLSHSFVERLIRRIRDLVSFQLPVAA